MWVAWQEETSFKFMTNWYKKLNILQFGIRVFTVMYVNKFPINYLTTLKYIRKRWRTNKSRKTNILNIIVNNVCRSSQVHILIN